MDEQGTGPGPGEAAAADASRIAARLIREEFGEPTSTLDETAPVPVTTAAGQTGQPIHEEFAAPARPSGARSHRTGMLAGLGIVGARLAVLVLLSPGSGAAAAAGAERAGGQSPCRQRTEDRWRHRVADDRPLDHGDDAQYQHADDAAASERDGVHDRDLRERGRDPGTGTGTATTATATADERAGSATDHGTAAHHEHDRAADDHDHDHREALHPRLALLSGACGRRAQPDCLA